MIFRDRQDAGRQLADRLISYKGHEDTLILGLPRGGVVVAYEIAEALDLPLDVICPRKIGAPGNPEFAIGAITETGQGIFDHQTIQYLGVTEEFLREAIASERKQAERRLQLFRKGLPPRRLQGKTVILVDDGLATGATMKAAIQSVKAEGASYTVVAVPVSPHDTVQEIQEMVDEVICLDTPPLFQAIGQFYESFAQTEDEEVIMLLAKCKRQ